MSATSSTTTISRGCQAIFRIIFFKMTLATRSGSSTKEHRRRNDGTSLLTCSSKVTSSCFRTTLHLGPTQPLSHLHLPHLHEPFPIGVKVTRRPLSSKELYHGGVRGYVRRCQTGIHERLQTKRSGWSEILSCTILLETMASEDRKQVSARSITAPQKAGLPHVARCARHKRSMHTL